MGFQELCVDDPEWLNICQSVLADSVDEVIDRLAHDLAAANIILHHGCRVADAGVFYEHGINRNDPSKLADDVRNIVAEEEDLAFLRSNVEKKLNEFDHWDRDTGKVYLTADERRLMQGGGHYLIYGSEWILCVLGPSAYETLRKRGIPTFIRVSMPFDEQSHSVRSEFARKMLHEWTRIKVNASGDVWEINFSLILNRDVPTDWIVGHHHPKAVRDPLYSGIVRYSKTTVCPACSYGL